MHDHADQPPEAAANARTARRAVLLRRLSDARAILGCGDDPDRTAAIDEVERLEAELATLEAGAPAAPR